MADSRHISLGEVVVHFAELGRWRTPWLFVTETRVIDVERQVLFQLHAGGLTRIADIWKGLKTIEVVTSRCVRDEKETIEVRYDISSLAMGVKRFARAVRDWGIENTCHGVLDYDVSRGRVADPRDRRTRENFAWLDRFTLSLLKQHPDKASLVMKHEAVVGTKTTRSKSLLGATASVDAGPVVPFLSETVLARE